MSSTATVMISLRAAATVQAKVDWQTVDGTAIAGTDYTTASGSVIFNPGESTKLVTIQVLDSSSTSTTDIKFFNVLISTQNTSIAITESIARVLLVPQEVLAGSGSGTGAPGDSAYQVAVDGGFVGTQAEWLASLKGAKGDTGATGPAGPKGDAGAAGTPGATGPAGTPGTAGAAGKSAYQVAVDAGFSGTQSQWLASLQGEQGPAGIQGPKGDNGTVGATGPKGDAGSAGKSAYQTAVDGGYVGTEAQWIASLKGSNGADGAAGKSAYQTAVDGGFVGTEAQWIASMKGETGAQGPKGDNGTVGATGPAGSTGASGKSAYQSALDSGFIGSESEWIASMKGDKGDTGAQGPTGAKGDKGDVGSTGPAGEQGIQGIQGVQGPKGDIGLTGAKGDKGDTGSTGLQGPKGDTGAQGPIGNTGPKGDKGDTGADGKSFSVDATGPTAERNDYDTEAKGFSFLDTSTGLLYIKNSATSGDWGDGIPFKGDKGEKGDTGAQGPIGDTGPKGDTGLTGAKGDQGDIGLTGAKGDKGDTGSTGKSAYQTAVDGGFVGTEVEWIASLKGVKGDTGAQGPIGDTGPAGPKGDTGDQGIQGIQGVKGDTGTQGPKGDTGASGESAYQTAVDGGFVGTEVEWIASLKGVKGDTGTAGAPGAKGDKGDIGLTGAKGDKGDTGEPGPKGDTGAAGADGADGAPGAKGDTGPAGSAGPDGASAYQVAVAGGYVGTEADWLLTLKGANGTQGEKGDQGDVGPAGEAGPQGPDGASAYQIAVAGGYSGTEVEWLASLKGANGADGKDGKDGITGAPGAPGSNGNPGATWYTGEIAPDVSTGIDGDYYLLSSTVSTTVGNGNVYHKDTGAWVLTGNILGPAGSGGSGSVTFATTEQAKAATSTTVASSPARVREYMENWGLTATYTTRADDLDTIVHGQFFNYDATTLNYPGESGYGRGLCIPSGDGYVTQLAIENDSGLMYVRYTSAGVWSSWMAVGGSGGGGGSGPALATNAQALAGTDITVASSPARVREYVEQYGFTNNFTPAPTDLDTVTRSQFFNYGNTTLNIPAASTYGRGIMIPSGGGYSTMIAFENDSGKMYVRYCNNGTWGAWTTMGGTSYTLPTATASVLGGVKVGSGLAVTSGTISVPVASATVQGGIKVGTGLSITSGVLSATGGGSYTLPPATASVLGGVKIGAGVTVAADGTISVSGGGSGGGGDTAVTRVVKATNVVIQSLTPIALCSAPVVAGNVYKVRFDAILNEAATSGLKFGVGNVGKQSMAIRFTFNGTSQVVIEGGDDGTKGVTFAAGAISGDGNLLTAEGMLTVSTSGTFTIWACNATAQYDYRQLSPGANLRLELMGAATLT